MSRFHSVHPVKPLDSSAVRDATHTDRQASLPRDQPSSDRRDDSRFDEFKAGIVEHAAAMVRFGLSLSRNPHSAEDLAQEAVARALAAWRQFRPGTDMRAWLLTIVRNTFINNYRRERKAPSAVDFAASGWDIPDHPAIARDTGFSARTDDRLDHLNDMLDDEVAEALGSLPNTFRIPFLMATLDGLAYRDISRLLGIPTGTVMSRIFRARRQLAGRLQTYGTTQGLA